jgi:hypothetical protein
MTCVFAWQTRRKMLLASHHIAMSHRRHDSLTGDMTHVFAWQVLTRRKMQLFFSKNHKQA